jgi:hypothetical protein
MTRTHDDEALGFRCYSSVIIWRFAKACLCKIHIFLPVVVTNICAAAAQLFLSSFQPIRDALPRGICNLAANPDNDLSHHHEMFVTS